MFFLLLGQQKTKAGETYKKVSEARRRIGGQAGSTFPTTTLMSSPFPPLHWAHIVHSERRTKTMTPTANVNLQPFQF